VPENMGPKMISKYPVCDWGCCILFVGLVSLSVWFQFVVLGFGFNFLFFLFLFVIILYIEKMDKYKNTYDDKSNEDSIKIGDDWVKIDEYLSEIMKKEINANYHKNVIEQYKDDDANYIKLKPEIKNSVYNKLNLIERRFYTNSYYNCTKLKNGRNETYKLLIKDYDNAKHKPDCSINNPLTSTDYIKSTPEFMIECIDNETISIKIDELINETLKKYNEEPIVENMIKAEEKFYKENIIEDVNNIQKNKKEYIELIEKYIKEYRNILKIIVYIKILKNGIYSDFNEAISNTSSEDNIYNLKINDIKSLIYRLTGIKNEIESAKMKTIGDIKDLFDLFNKAYEKLLQEKIVNFKYNTKPFLKIKYIKLDELNENEKGKQERIYSDDPDGHSRILFNSSGYKLFYVIVIENKPSTEILNSNEKDFINLIINKLTVKKMSDNENVDMNKISIEVNPENNIGGKRKVSRKIRKQKRRKTTRRR
jgi:hypothetical protein